MTDDTKPASPRRRVLTGLAATLATVPLVRAGAAGGDVTPNMLARGTSAYEAARRRSCWQLSTPERFPDLIVEARSAADVADVLRYARARHTTVAVKGSGHNYTSTFLREGGVLLDLSKLKNVVIDSGTHAAWTQPGITNGELSAALTARGRAFPTGHHAGVGLGGFLLGGGMGWNGESWGQFACFNVRAVDVVTADGKAITVDARSHPDLYWAARGGGPLFCGVATGFHLKTYPAPGAILASRYTYPLAAAGQIARWLQRIADQRIPDLDLFLLLLSEDHPAAGGNNERRQTALVYALSYGATRSAAESALKRVGQAAPQADVLERDELTAVSFADLYSESLTGPARRTGADTAWTNDAVGATEVLAKHFEKVPSAATVGIINYRGRPRLPADAACSMSGSGFIQWLGQWDEASRDQDNLMWVEQTARLLEPYTVGAYVNESDIIRRPERLRRCFNAGAFARLRSVRETYDPNGVLPPPVFFGA